MQTTTPSNGSLEYYYYYYYEYVQEPFQVTPIPEMMPLMGYVYPLLSLFTVLTNCVVISVFSKKKMRTPTSIILIAIAMFDSLTCVCLVPQYVYLIPLQNYRHYIPYSWCVYRHYTSNVYKVMHTTSNWITVCLSIQRYIIVRLPFKAKQICSKKSSLIAIVCCFILAVLIHLNLFLAITIKPFRPEDQSGQNITLPLGCVKGISELYIEIVGDLQKAVTVYYMFSGLLSRLLPCCILLIMTILLVRELRRDHMFLHSDSNDNKSSRRNQKITKFVVAVLVIFIVCELQDAIAFLIYVHELATNQTRQILSKYADDIWDQVGIILTLIGCHCNFWIYLLMSAQFRTTLRDLCCCCCILVRKRVPSLTVFTSLSDSSRTSDKKKPTDKHNIYTS